MDRDSRDASSYAAGSNHLGALKREQSIEFNCRRDICYGVVATTGALFSERKKLLDQLSGIDHPSRRRMVLYITLLAIGALLDYLIRDGKSGFDLNFGTAIWAAAILMTMQKMRERSRLAARLTIVLDHLRLAERTWLSGGGDSNEF